jgi:hypothetical protein
MGAQGDHAITIKRPENLKANINASGIRGVLVSFALRYTSTVFIGSCA